MPAGESQAQRTSHRAETIWAWSMGGIVAALLMAIVFTALHWGLRPPSQVETIDCERIQLGGEFSEGNLGTAVSTSGTVTIRVLAQRYAFIPHCILAPAGVALAIRVASSDVVHGLIVQGTNINTMVIPGYVSTVDTRFAAPGDHLMPCDEFCGVGHQAMWAEIRVVDSRKFPFARARRGPVDCERR